MTRSIDDIRASLADPTHYLRDSNEQDVRVLMDALDRSSRARADRFFVSGQMLATVEAVERSPEEYAPAMRCLAAGLRRALEKDTRVSREEAFALVERELRDARVYSLRVEVDASLTLHAPSIKLAPSSNVGIGATLLAAVDSLKVKP